MSLYKILGNIQVYIFSEQRMLLCFVFFLEQSPTQLISCNHQDTNTSKRYLPYIMKTEKFSYKTRNKRAAADNPIVNDYVNGEKKT